MYKLIALILVSAVCVQSQSSANANTLTSAAGAYASDVHTLNPILIDRYGYEIGTPLLAPNLGLWTLLNAAPLSPRSFIGQSNPVLIRDGYADHFIGRSKLGMLAI